jgi:heterogeneous nuclear rnp K-like protein 2
LTVSGVADAIHIAVYYVGTILQEQSEKAYENRSYRPGNRESFAGAGRDSHDRDYRGRDDDRRGGGGGGDRERPARGPGHYVSTAEQPGSQTQQFFIPDDLVASIIGKGGAKINEVRQKSATNIKIMEPNEEPQRNAGAPEGDRVRSF